MLRNLPGTALMVLILSCWTTAAWVTRAAGSHAREGIYLHLKEQAKVNGDLILLGDIAEIKGEDVSLIKQLQRILLGKSPRPGYTKMITFQNILYQLGKGHFDPEILSFSGPDRCKVERQCREITARELEAFFVRQFHEQFSDKDIELDSVKSHLSTNLKISTGKITFEISSSEPPSRSKENFALEIRRDGQLVKHVWVSATLRYHITVAVAQRDLSRGQQITPADIAPQEIISTQRDLDQISDPAQAIGMICRQPVRRGTALSTKMLEKPLLIKKGAIIKIIAKNRNLRVESLGKALADGYQGHVIPVQNLASQKSIYGEVIGENKINIHF
jgi:flagella basal body P-ring formation protein FlgA